MLLKSIQRICHNKALRLCSDRVFLAAIRSVPYLLGAEGDDVANAGHYQRLEEESHPRQAQNCHHQIYGCLMYIKNSRNANTITACGQKISLIAYWQYKRRIMPPDHNMDIANYCISRVNIARTWQPNMMTPKMLGTISPWV